MTGGATTTYVYDARGNLAAEYSTCPNPDSGAQYLTNDALGSTRLITTGTTAPVFFSRSDYLPFGQEIPTTWASRASYDPDPSETLKFTGKERDAESGLDFFVLAQAIKTDPALATSAIVMLTSAGVPGEAARCRELGIAAYLPKPIKRSELFSAILLALGLKTAERDRPASVTRRVLREACQAGRILLVEDNKVNHLVARRLLEKRGHQVIVANNGREALAILDEAGSVKFDCVFMDIQMPGMGGFECTAIIRDRERTTASHLQIIAMTHMPSRDMKPPAWRRALIGICRSPLTRIISLTSLKVPLRCLGNRTR